MKKLLFIPMLFVCYMGMGQASAGGGGGKHFIGEKFGGGIVFDVSPDGLHGLISETQDQTKTQDSIKYNTLRWYDAQDVISEPKNHSNAGNSYRDWRLPSKSELDKLFLNKNAVGGFVSHYYWSSTEKDSYDAWIQYFVNGRQLNNKKTDPFCVRAIRSF